MKPSRMHRSAAGFAAFSLAFLALPSLAAPSRDNVTLLATVNDEPLTTLELDALLASERRPTGETSSFLTPEGLLDRIIQNRLLEQEGYRASLHEKPEVRNQVWDLRRHKGMLALLDSVSAEARKADDSALVSSLQQTSTMLRVSQILVLDEARAWDLHDSLRAGVPFGELAERHSADTTAAIAAGGDLGWLRKDLFVPSYAAALDELSPGEFSEPVRSERGWNLLYLADSRTETVGQSAEMEDALREAARGERVMAAIEEYVRSLFRKYGATVDSTLLASLDYGSADPKVRTELQSSERVLVRFPWRTLTVRDLSQEIRFQHFHGLANKPDAARLRDEAFHEWTTQLLLRHEASELGFDRTPILLLEAEALERRLVREAVLNLVLDVDFVPTEAEVANYHAAHPDEFRSTPRFRVNGLLLDDEEAARSARQMLGNGARIGWIAANAEGVVDRNPADLSGWLEAADVAFEGVPAVGTALGPFPLGENWAVAEVIEVESTRLLGLEECRPRVLQALKAEAMRAAMQRAVERLEESAVIEIAKDAEKAVAERIDAWMGSANAR